ESFAVGRDADLAERRRTAYCAATRATLIDHEMLGADQRSFGDDERALDDVLQLANVARPAVCTQHADRVKAKLTSRSALESRGLRQQMIGDEARIVVTLAKRRQLNS